MGRWDVSPPKRSTVRLYLLFLAVRVLGSTGLLAASIGMDLAWPWRAAAALFLAWSVALTVLVFRARWAKASREADGSNRNP